MACIAVSYPVITEVSSMLGLYTGCCKECASCNILNSYIVNKNSKFAFLVKHIVFLFPYDDLKCFKITLALKKCKVTCIISKRSFLPKHMLKSKYQNTSREFTKLKIISSVILM